MNRYLFKCMLALSVLLATVTAAAAQEELAGMVPAIEAKGESASPAATVTEMEPNNGFSRANPIALGDVVGGKIGYANDIDMFVLSIAPETTVSVLIDVDAQMNGSPLDAVICLYDRAHTQLACNDNANGADPLIFKYLWPENISPGSPYYILVQSAHYPNDGGSAFTYRLAVYRPLLVSAAVNGNAAGVPFQKADVLAHYDFADGTEKWMLFFDASDVGVTQNVIALAAGEHADLSLTLQYPQSLPIYNFGTDEFTSQKVTPYDVLGFVGCDYLALNTPCGQFGPTTAGLFYFDYRGADYGLTAASEKIDALAIPWWVSTVGATTFASGVAVADEDISNLPYGKLYFDGSLTPGLAAEDVFAADVYQTVSGSEYYLTLLGSGRIGGEFFTQKDIFVVNSAHLLSGLYWRGPSHHFNYNLDAFDAAD